MKVRFSGLMLVFCAFILVGCSTVKEAARGVIGISTKEVEESRKDALVKQFNYSYNDCYDKTMEVLKYIGAYVYTEDPKKNMIAVYVSASDTTVAGVFFKKIDPANTQVEVASPSTYAKELIAENVFAGLDGTLDMEKDFVSPNNTIEQE
ncbi:MAG: hypothetical protein WC532_05340 [Candidatus Omnitrophota bacterium]